MGNGISIEHGRAVWEGCRDRSKGRGRGRKRAQKEL